MAEFYESKLRIHLADERRLLGRTGREMKVVVSSILIEPEKGGKDMKLKTAFAAVLLMITLAMANPLYVYAYNRLDAISYADRWALSRNPSYKSFSADCTNFTSQCLKAGGYPFVGWGNTTVNDPFSWWYNNKNTPSTYDDAWTYTWTVAANQYTFIVLDSSPNWGYVASSYVAPSNPYPYGIQPGDLFYYDWTSDGVIDHSAIYVANGVCQYTGYSGALQNQHSNDRYHVIWTLYSLNPDWYRTRIYCVHLNG